jgi:hypothetical protein
MIAAGTALYSNTDALELYHENEWTTPFTEIVQPKQRTSVKLSDWRKGAVLGVATGKTSHYQGINYVQLTIVYDHPFWPAGGWFHIGVEWRSVTLTAWAQETDVTTVGLADAKNADKAKKEADYQKQLDAINKDKVLTGNGSDTKPQNYVLYVVIGVVCVVAGLVGYTLYRRNKSQT